MERVRVGKSYRTSESVRQSAELALHWLQADTIARRMKLLSDDVHIYTITKLHKFINREWRNSSVSALRTCSALLPVRHVLLGAPVSGFYLHTSGVCGSVLPAPAPAWLPSWFGCCYLVTTPTTPPSLFYHKGTDQHSSAWLPEQWTHSEAVLPSEWYEIPNTVSWICLYISHFSGFGISWFHDATSVQAMTFLVEECRNSSEDKYSKMKRLLFKILITFCQRRNGESVFACVDVCVFICLDHRQHIL